MRKFLALAAMLALATSAHAGLRVKAIDVPWYSAARYANTQPAFIVGKETKASARTDTTFTFSLNDAVLRPNIVNPSGTLSSGSNAALVYGTRDSLPLFGKIAIVADSTATNWTADSLVVTLYQVTFNVPLTMSAGQTTVVDMSSLKATQLCRWTVGGFSTDNTTGECDIPLQLGSWSVPLGTPAQGTATTASNFTISNYLCNPVLGGQFFCTVKTVGGTIPGAHFRVLYYVDDATYMGN